MGLKKKGKIIAVICCAIIGVTALNVPAAENNNVSYSFQIGKYHKNGRVSNGRYRSTTDVRDSWKVKMLYSGEGEGTITDYWLENYNEDNVSEDVSIKQGDPAIYSQAWPAASKVTVYLTGENNNFNGAKYNVRGYWDEETGIYVK